MAHGLGEVGLFVRNLIVQGMQEFDAREEERIRRTDSLEIDHGSRKWSRGSEAENEEEDEADDGQEMVQEDEEDDEQEDELSMVQCEEDEDEYPCSVKEGGTRGEKKHEAFFCSIFRFCFCGKLVGFKLLHANTMQKNNLEMLSQFKFLSRSMGNLTQSRHFPIEDSTLFYTASRGR